MLRWLKNTFNTKSKLDYFQMFANGAKLIDVRKPLYFYDNHVPGALNVPYNDFKNRIQEIVSLDDEIIVCCSGKKQVEGQSFSELATKYLRDLGYINVHTAGNFQNLLLHSIN